MLLEMKMGVNRMTIWGLKHTPTSMGKCKEMSFKHFQVINILGVIILIILKQKCLQMELNVQTRPPIYH
jgi:hypothetical protein